MQSADHLYYICVCVALFAGTCRVATQQEDVQMINAACHIISALGNVSLFEMSDRFLFESDLS